MINVPMAPSLPYILLLGSNKYISDSDATYICLYRSREDGDESHRQPARVRVESTATRHLHAMSRPLYDRSTNRRQLRPSDATTKPRRIRGSFPFRFLRIIEVLRSTVCLKTFLFMCTFFNVYKTKLVFVFYNF